MRLTYDPPLATAVLSDCGAYRYRLGRTWDPSGWGACFVMLNPSTADARFDDPTIRRCIDFARRMGAGWLSVVNLFALRATDPRALLTAPDPIGPDNDRHIIEAVADCPAVVCAWGAHRMASERAEHVRGLLAPRRLHALRLTKGGAPRHPLYLPKSATLCAWPSSGRGSSRGSGAPDRRIRKRANGFEPSTFSLGSKKSSGSEGENAGNIGGSQRATSPTGDQK